MSSPPEKPPVAEAISSSRSSTETHQVETPAILGDLEKTFSQHEVGAITVPQEPLDDPNIVNWDGPDDPEHPTNWPAKKKWINLWLIALITLLTPFDSSMFAPAVPEVMEQFHSDSDDMASFVVSIYVLGYAFGPLLIAPMSELYGRLPVYHVNQVLFIVFNIGCAKSTSLSMLTAFRFLTGLAGSCPITIGSGSIADTFKQEQRGLAMSIWVFPVLFGPSIGPLVGSYLSDAAGWAWDYYLIAICTAVLLLVALIIQRETYPPILLERRVRRLRKETGNQNLRSAFQSSKTPSQLFLVSIIRPTKMLFLSPIILGLSILIAVTYGYLYILFTTVNYTFTEQYGISAKNVGLTYLGLGVGQFFGLLMFGFTSDRMLKWMAKAGLLLYGWTTEYKVHYMVPIVGTGIFAAGMLGTYMAIGSYIIDAFTLYAASATAATTVLRSLGGAVLPLAGPRMFNALGLGWGSSLLAFISLALTPMIWVFNKYGEKIRNHPKYQLNL